MFKTQLYYLFFLLILFLQVKSQSIQYFDGYAIYIDPNLIPSKIKTAYITFNNGQKINIQYSNLINGINITLNDTLSELGVLLIQANQQIVVSWNPYLIQNINTIPTEGGSIIISGKYLNDSNSYITISNEKYYNFNYSLISNSFNIGSNLSGLGLGNLNFVYNLRESDISSILPNNFNYKGPSIYSASLNEEKNRLSFYGSSFGPNIDWIKCTIESYQTSIIPSSFIPHHNVTLEWSDNNLKNNLNIAGQKTLNLQLTDMNKYSVNTNYKFYIRPIIKNITNLSSDYGGLVIITGLYFNKYQPNEYPSEISIMIGEFPCINPDETYSESNQFHCLLKLDPNVIYDNSSLLNLPITVTISGASSENKDVVFNFDVPTLNDTGYIQNGSEIIFTGQRFGRSNSNQTFILISNQTMTINSTSFSSIDINPPTITDFTKQDDRVWSFKFSIPDTFIAGQYHAVMTTHNKLISNNITFQITPSISSISSPSIHGGEITINGGLFSIPSITIDNTINGNETINCTNIKLISSKMITCQVSNGTGKDIIFTLTIGGNTITHSFNYQGPKIDNVTSITEVLGEFTIFGSNFASKKLEVSVNGVQCQNPILINENSITCTFLKTDIDIIKQKGNINQTLTVSINRQSTTSNIFEIVPISGKAPYNWLPVALPIGIVAVLLVVVTSVILTVKITRKEMKRRALEKFINS